MLPWPFVNPDTWHHSLDLFNVWALDDSCLSNSVHWFNAQCLRRNSVRDTQGLLCVCRFVIVILLELLLAARWIDLSVKAKKSIFSSDVSHENFSRKIFPETRPGIKFQMKQEQTS